MRVCAVSSFAIGCVFLRVTRLLESHSDVPREFAISLNVSTNWWFMNSADMVILIENPCSSCIWEISKLCSMITIPFKPPRTSRIFSTCQNIWIIQQIRGQTEWARGMVDTSQSVSRVYLVNGLTFVPYTYCSFAYRRGSCMRIRGKDPPDVLRGNPCIAGMQQGDGAQDRSSGIFGFRCK